jgi:hypothetical protein
LKEVAAHSACWAKAGPPIREGKRAASTLERWQQVHELLDRGVGLLECARRLNISLNTVKRYARAGEPDRLVRAPQYRPTLVDPFRDQLRARRAADPAVPVLQLLEEIRAMGYTGSQNLLYRYITQGRVEAERSALSPRKVTRLLLTRPDDVRNKDRDLIAALTAACSEMSEWAEAVRSFADLVDPREENAEHLNAWIATIRAIDLPHLHAFTRGLDLDKGAVRAAVTMLFHNGGTEGVNTKTKRIMRQMHGRAGFTLLRHRILLS